MDKKTFEKLLGEKGLKITRTRLAVLLSFGQGGVALTHQQIREQLALKVDRVSLYRILEAFIRSRLLIRLNDDYGISFFILDTYGDAEWQITPLFRCSGCNRVSVLPDLPPSYANILKQKYIKTQPVFNGLCRNCHHD